MTSLRKKPFFILQRSFFMYYSTTSANYHIITRNNVCRYLSQNTRIPDHIYGIATEAFQKKPSSVLFNFQNHSTGSVPEPFLDVIPFRKSPCLTRSHKSDQVHFPNVILFCRPIYQDPWMIFHKGFSWKAVNCTLYIFIPTARSGQSAKTPFGNANHCHPWYYRTV